MTGTEAIRVTHLAEPMAKVGRRKGDRPEWCFLSC